MRKVTVIFIVLVFISSIMIVNFFGLNYKIYDKNQYLEKIEVYDVNSSSGIKIKKQTDDKLWREDKDGLVWISVEYEKLYSQKTGEDQLIMITPHCLPDNANDKTLVISYDETKSDLYYFEANTLVPTLILKSPVSKKTYLTVSFTLKSKINTKTSVSKSFKIVIYVVDTLSE